MGRVVTILALLAAASRPAFADDPLARARSLYNQKQFEAAVTADEQARATPAHADAADLVAARAYLERYRASQTSDDLTNARDRLRRIDPQRFQPRERMEYVVGLGEALYFDGAYGAAATVFDSVLQSHDQTSADARERVLDWQHHQEFPLCPNPDDPDACNVYKDLQFPDQVYDNISEYYEQKAES